MLKRKIEAYLEEWKNSERRSPLIVKGMRQVGKTYAVRKFAVANYKNVFFLDFRKNPDYGSLFEGDFDISSLVSSMSAMPNETRLIPNSKMVPGETVLVFDEIQDCPNARSSLRYFKEDGRFDVICTGSMLGVSGFRVTKKPFRGIPVGSEEVIEMKSLDFEEFLWANGIEESTIDILKNAFDERKEIPLYLHKRMFELVRQYIVIGGMPEVVNLFLEKRDFRECRKKAKQILLDFQADFGTHLNDDGEIVIDEVERARLLQVFNSIPRQLAKGNSKFQYSTIGHGARNRTHEGALAWLEGYGLISRCHNLTNIQEPFSFFVEDNHFKVFLSDIGLLVAMLDDEVPFQIISDQLEMGKGPIYENLVSEAFHKLGKKQYYYEKNSGLKIDFVAYLFGCATLIEAKSKEGRTKAAKTVLADNGNSAKKILKLTAQNIGEAEDILTAPYYLSFYALNH